MFSLKKLVKGAFDGGSPFTVQQPAQTPQPQQSRPAPASTARPQGGLSVAPVKQNNLVQNQPIAQPTINTQPIQPKKLTVAAPQPRPQLQAAVAKQQPLQVGTATIAQGTGTAGIEGKERDRSFQEKYFAGVPGTVGLGLARSAVGTGQAASGLYDLATPGTGTNRFSKAADIAAKYYDAQAQNSNQALYKGSQLAGDLGTFGGAGKVLKAAPYVAEAGKGADIINDLVRARTAGLEAGNAGQRILAKTIQGATNPRLLAGNVAANGFYAGQQSSRGEDINPYTFAAQTAAGQVAAPLTGALAQEAIRPVADKAISALRGVDLIAPSALNRDEVAALSAFNDQARSGALMDEGLYQRGIAAARKAGIDYRDPRQVDELLGAHRTFETTTQQRVQALQTARDSVVQFAQDHPPGLSTRAVDENGNPISVFGTKKVKGVIPEPTHPSGVPRSKLVTQSPDVAAPATGTTQLVSKAETGAVLDNQPPIVGNPIRQRAPASRLGRTKIQENVNPKPLSDEEVLSLPANKTTDVRLNQDRLALHPDDAEALSDETAQTIEKMSNKDVQQIAKSAGIDTKSHNIQQTRQKIAEQLNVRRDAVALLNKAKATTDTDERANLLLKAAERGRTSREQGTDLARQLQARRIIANELDSPEQRLFKLLDNAGVNPEVYSKRLAEVDFNNPKEVVKAYREMVPAKFGDWLDKYRYTNMLSSPLTQVRNISGNLIGGTTIRPIQKAVEGSVDTVRSLATGKERTRFAGEAGAYLKGFGTSVNDAAKAFSDVWTGKAAQANPDMDFLQNAPLAEGGIKGAADTALSFVSKLMESFDQAGVALVKGGETRALKYREAKGIDPGNIENKAQEAADYTLFRQQLNKPGQGHLLGAIDFIPSKVSEARSSKNPVIRNSSKLIFPFVKTPANISKQMVEYSPLGVLTLPGAADKEAQLAKAVMGTIATSVTAGTLAADNRLTFAQPTDAKEKQKFLAEGKQAYSIKVGNKWVSYQYLHPAISFQLAATAAVNDSVRNKKMDSSTADKVLTGLAQTSRFFVDQSYFKNAQDFLNNVQGTGNFGSQATTALSSQASNIANQFVPVRAAQTWLNNFIDKTQRQPDNAASAFEQFKQQFSSQIPGLSTNVPARKDNLGNDLPKQSPVINNFSPARISTEKTDNRSGVDALTNEVDRLARQDNSIALAKQTAKQNIAGTDVKLDKQQQKGLTESVNTKVKDAWNQVINNPGYAALSDEDKRHALSSAKTDATSAAKREFGSANNIALKDKASNSDVAIINGTKDYGSYLKKKNSQGKYSDTGDINSGINEHSKKVLTEYAGLDDATKKKKSYSENDYDYKVLKAKYDNDKANGKISEIDDVNKQETLGKAKIGSKYSKDIRDAYSKLSKNELVDYVDKHPDKADQILALDNELASKGFISKAKYAYGIGGSKGTSSNAANSKIASAFGKANSTNRSADSALRDLIGKDRISSKGANVRKANVRRAATKKNTVAKSKVTVKRG